MPTHNLARTVARDAARIAGKLCLAVRGDMLRSMSYVEKAGQEPVTLADYGAQAVALQYIQQRFPDDCTIAEEGASEFETLTTSTQRHQVVHYVSEAVGKSVSFDDIRRWLDFGCAGDSKRKWVVDPIDGTKGFLRGDQFAVAVALVFEGQPMVGALACPMMPLDERKPDHDTGIVAVAARSEGATIEPLNGGYARPLRVANQRSIEKARVVESVEADHTDHAFHENVFSRAGVGGEVVRIDSQAKYVTVADGRAEIYIRHSGGRDYREKIWDHAAGALIVREAGGKVTDLDGKPLNFGLGERLENNRGILATNGYLHDQMLDAIRAEKQAT